MFFLGTKVFSSISDEAKDFACLAGGKPTAGTLVMLNDEGLAVEADGTKPILGCAMHSDDLMGDYCYVQLSGTVRAKVMSTSLVGFAPFYDSADTDGKSFATGGLVLSRHADFYHSESGLIEPNSAIVLLGGA